MSKKKGSRRSGASTAIFNCLTFLAVVGILCVGGTFLTIFLFPNSGINPFPPLPPLPTVPALPSVTPTPIQVLPPTWTPMPTSTVTPSRTLNPSRTPIPSFTPLPPATQEGVSSTPTVNSEFAFMVQAGNPIAIQNITHPDLGCNWMGVGGQAIDLKGSPVVGLVVQLNGFLGGVPMDSLSLTGSAAPFGYGPAGYEFTLADSPRASNNGLYVQLLDQAGLPMSDKIYFNTFGDCDHNLVLINFVQVR